MLTKLNKRRARGEGEEKVSIYIYLYIYIQNTSFYERYIAVFRSSKDI